MKFLIAFAVLSVMTMVSASPIVERRHPIVKRSVVLTPVEVVEAGPVVRRKARQFGFGGGFDGLGGLGGYGGGYDNTNIGGYNQGGSFAGPFGIGGYDNSGFDYNNQQGYGNGFGGFGGLGGFGF